MKIKIILLLVASVILGTSIVFNVRSSNELNITQQTYNQLEEKNQRIALKQMTEKIIVDQTGAPSSMLKKESELIKTVFKTATTFKDGASYQKNRNDLKQLVTAPNFFETYVPEDVDVTGNSYVDGLSAKSIFVSANIYQLETSHEYLTIIESIPYTRDETMDIKDLDSLNKQVAGFIITVSKNGETIEKFKKIKGLNNK